MGAPIRLLVTVNLVAALVGAASTARADTETAEVARAVALRGVEGPGADAINEALIAALEKNGYSVERGRAANGAESSGYVAVVTGKIVKRDRRYKAVIELRSAPGGKPLASVQFHAANPKLLAKEIRREAWNKFGPSLETRFESLTETMTTPPVAEPRTPRPVRPTRPAPVTETTPKEAPVVTHGTEAERVYAQADGTEFHRLHTRGARRKGPIAIDGKGDDKAWEASAETVLDWAQKPAEGFDKVSSLTYFRALYDDEAIYVFVRAVDPEPDKIAGILNRGDNFNTSVTSDWVAVLFDPTLSQRYGYGFQVNPVGVKIDFRVLDDSNRLDLSYNAVWEVATRKDENGWYAEYRIPISQVRFDSGYQKEWGFQVYRRFQRDFSHAYWSPQPISTGRSVGLWGRLEVDDQVTPARAIQITPFTAAGIELSPVAEGDTINDEVRPLGKLGVDLQVALTKGLVFTSAVNPDFGQVEADPSEVNLSGRETFFSERRPFFTKDDELFLFPVGRGSERIYYTRRIGATPRLSQSAGAQFVDEDQATSIYNASKITGQLPGGLTMGVLAALTAEESSRAQLSTGEIQTATIDPMTVYGIGQVGKTFRAGGSDIRFSGTTTHRFLDGTGIDTLSRNAYSGGLQFDHRFADQTWGLFFQGIGSYVDGSARAIDLVQRASPRYFQRPDAEHLDYDPERTSLAGYAGRMSMRRVGLNWKGSVGIDARSPGFETNDVGFLLDADLIDTWAEVSYINFNKGGLAKQIDISGSADSFADFSGDLLRHKVGVVNTISFRNDAVLATNMSYQVNLLNTRLLRGGPAIAGSDEAAVGMSYTTDAKAALQIKPGVDFAFQPDSDSRRYTAAVDVRWNVLSNVELNITPTFTSNIDDSQFVPPPLADAMGTPHFILGRIYQRTLFATTRLSYTFTPKVAFDLYAQPFLSVGEFSDFKEPNELRSRNYEQRFRDVSTTENMGMVGADFDNDGTADATFRSPDFSITRLNTNLVFRWEYLPGSFMYAIFSSAARGFEPDGTLSSRDYETVWTADSEKVVLIKLSYWWDR